MSLQVWLPLNGDLRNQGLSKTSITNNGATINDNGKIGKCYSFDGSDDFISLNNQKLYDIFKGGTQQFSIAFWVYHADATRAIIFGDYGLIGSISFNIELTASHAVRFYWAGAPDKNFNSTSYVTASAWTHICLTYDGSKVQIYRNGILSTDVYNGTLAAKNKTSGAFYLGRDNRTGTTALNGRLNDFRIYDHCLSEKEVKKISQGLVLHCQLKENIPIKNNLMPNSLIMGLGSANASTGTWRVAGTNTMTRSRVAIIDTPDGNGYGFQNVGVQTGSDGSCYGIDSFPLAANTIYTIYMWARITSGIEGYAGYNIYGSTDIIGSHKTIDKNYRVTQLSSSGEWTLCWLTFLTNSATTRNIYIGITTGENSVTTQMCNVHIYQGKLFENFLMIQDSSGYNNNGELIGDNLVYNSFSPKYNNCTLFNGTNNCIIIPYKEINPDGIFTVNLWFFKDKIGTKNYETLFGGPSGFEMDTRAGSATTLSLYMASTRGSTLFSPLSFSTWYMITLVRDGINEFYYVNGELKKTIEAKPMPNGIYRIGAWASDTGQNYYGNMSDFRIYATALSADDILKLYKTSKIVNGTAATARDLE